MESLIFTKIFSVLAVPFIFVAGLFSTPANLNLGASIPQVAAVFETSLLSPITSSATSLTLTANSVRGGSTLSGFNCFTIDEGRAEREDVCGTVSGTSMTGITRGVDPLTATTTNATLQFAHRRGAQVKITDFPLIGIMRHQLNGSDTFPNTLAYASSTILTQASTTSTQIPYVGWVFNNFVDKYNTQVIAGAKTFSNTATFSVVPTSASAPVAGSDLANKTYVDGVAIVGASNADTTTKGIVEEATVAEINAGTATGGTGAKLFIQPASFAQSTYASTTYPLQFDNNLYGESNDGSNPRGSTDNFQRQIFPTGTNTWAIIDYTSGYYATRSGTSDYAASTRPFLMAIIGSYAYVGLTEGTAPRVYRFDRTNIGAGGTLMTVSGQAFAATGYPLGATDGTSLFFTTQAGNSATTGIISKYSISGTTMTFVSNTTLSGAGTIGAPAIRASDGSFITYQSSDSKLRRYNSSGTLQATESIGFSRMWGNAANGSVFYAADPTLVRYYKVTLP